MDKNGDGFVEAHELKASLMREDCSFDPKQFKQLLDEMDGDDDDMKITEYACF